MKQGMVARQQNADVKTKQKLQTTGKIIENVKDNGKAKQTESLQKSKQGFF